jgi:DNA polymerase-3 subunit beta
MSLQLKGQELPISNRSHMKFSVSKEALIDGLNKTQNVVSSRANLPILSNVLIEAGENGLQLTTTDTDVTMRCSIPAIVEKPGATTIPVKRFSSIVRELPSMEVSVETDSKSNTKIRSGGSYFLICGLPAYEFPPFPQLSEGKEYKLQQSELKDGLRKTSYAISVDQTRYVLNGMLFAFKDNRLTLVATDGRRLALFETDLEFPQSLESEIIVPTKAINELQRLLGDGGEITIKATDNLVSFELNGSLLISKRIEGNYPNYRQVIPSEAKERITIEREAFYNAVHRVSLLSTDRSCSVRLTFTKNQLNISLNAPDIGEAQESLSVVYRGPELSIAFNPEFLLDPLRNLQTEEIYLELIDELSPGVIKIASPFLYVLMPMRVSA